MKINEIGSYIRKLNTDTVIINKKARYIHIFRALLFSLFKFVILLGICYIIIGPLISIIAGSFFSSTDINNPTVKLFPIEPTLDNYKLTFVRLKYWKTLGYTMGFVTIITMLQVLITSMAGYGFARFSFPFKKLLFACVIVTIVLPTHSIMLPLYQHFRNWDFFGIVSAIRGEKLNLLSTEIPMLLLTLFGCGLRSGLFIYIFRQFFRGLPKEIEEAAFIDGAGMWYTYLRIMLVNAVPSIITVTVFSMVWQYNDMFYGNLFSLPAGHSITLQLSTVQSTIGMTDQIKDPQVIQICMYAGVILVIIPIIAVYLILQKYFIEGVERSGIVG